MASRRGTIFENFILKNIKLQLYTLKLLTTPLRRVQGFPLLGLLWEFRYHVGYSEANPHSQLLGVLI